MRWYGKMGWVWLYFLKCVLEWYDDNGMMWKGCMNANPNEREWLVNGIDMKRVDDCELFIWDRVINE